MSKDLFSAHASQYAAHRPGYPEALVKWLASLHKYKGVAWDCGTGNGQMAVMLARYFHLVCASDLSAQMIHSAPAHRGIHYSVQPAEKTDFPSHYFDMVVVAQAIHWFDREAFFAEAKRVVKPGGVIALIGYGLCNIDGQIDEWLNDFYKNTTGPYWDESRKIIDDKYQNLSFPFECIPNPGFSMEVTWNAHNFMNYLNTWSAIQTMRSQGMGTVIEKQYEKLRLLWDDATSRRVCFPLLLKIGRI
jgi:ubiquinone/menaquinone biosynthesis C-methylase UbiE